MKQTFLLQGLNCPNCAARIEADVKKLPRVGNVQLNLMQQTLSLETEDDLLKRIETIVHTYEPDVKVLPKTEGVQHPNHPESKGMLLRMGVGAAVFAAALLLSGVIAPGLRLCLLIIAYIVLGADVVLSAGKNIIKGHVFDENFLMSLSSIGAFLIGEHPEAVAVMLFYQVGEYFQDLAVQRSRSSISELMDIRPDAAVVRRNGQLLSVAPETVGVGELIVVRPGEKIPLDGTVVEGTSMLDTRALTGESVPRKVGVFDPVLSGCINESGVLTIRVTKAYHESTVAKIIDLVENASGRKAPTEYFITKFARYYTPAVVIVAALLGVLPPLMFGGDWADWIHRAFVFLVVSCPCALVVSIPLTFFGGIGAASRHGVLVKGSNYLEALNNVDTVVFDKTGTLTKGVFKVTKILPAEGITEENVLTYAAKAEYFSTHPIARSILDAYGKSLTGIQITGYRELSGRGICANADGNSILAGSPQLLQDEKISFPLCELAGTKVYVALDGRYLGCIVIADEMKADSKMAIANLKKMGVRQTVMLTGDEEIIGKAVSEELGLDSCHANLLPQDKVAALEHIHGSKHPGGKLVFVGDGINDAPVLARADIGIAMGGLGSDAAIEAADVVLMTDEPSKLVEAMQIARETRKIVIQNILFALGVKALFLLLGAFGWVGMWLAVFGDVGVALLAVLNAMRILRK